jgi:hypothetical protein
MVGTSAALCVVAAGTLAWREYRDPYAQYDLNARIHLVQEALARADCVGARDAMRAAEALDKDAPELQGVRDVLDDTCGARRR